jgi:hypothetical protein
MTNSRLRGLPKKTIKRILTNECGGQVSTESVEFIQSFIENLLKDICKDVVIKQEKDNKLRKFHGLPPKKRFDVSIFKLVSVESINPQYSIIGVGEEGHRNRETSLSKKAEETEVSYYG